jgi:hypothetical protein
MAENKLNVTGRVLNLEEKTASNGEQFYIVDLQTFYGPSVRFQAWNEAHEFIQRNQIRAGVEGDYLDVEGYIHIYKLTNKQGELQEYTTFKSRNVKKPNATITISGVINNVNPECIKRLSKQTSFEFIPDLKGFDNGNWFVPKAIHCVVEDNNECVQLVNTQNRCTITGCIDNTDKRQTKVTVQNISIGEN